MTQWTPPQDNDDVQLPFGINQTEPEHAEEAAAPTKSVRISGPTLVLFVAFAGALLTIYFLGVRAKPRMANADQIAHDAQVKAEVAGLLKKPEDAGKFASVYNDTDKLVRMFRGYLGAEDEKPVELQHNPFESDMPTVIVTPSSPTAYVPPAGDTAEADRQRRAADYVQTLKLHSVMLGRIPAAMIDKHMVTVGAKLGDLTVTSIEADRVVLSCGSARFDLKLSNIPAD